MKKVIILFFLFCSLACNFYAHQAEWSGDIYNQNSLIQYNAALHVVSLISFNKNGSCLDIGCGNGKISEQIALQVPNGSVLGIDKSPNMIDFAAKTYSKDNLHFKNIDVTKLSFVNEFDYAVSFSCLHWVKDLLEAFKATARSLKSGGLFTFLMEPKNDYPLIKAMQEVFGDWGIEVPWSMHDRCEILAWLQEAGFNVLDNQDFCYCVSFESKEALAAWLSGLSYGDISKEDEKLMVDQIIDRYLVYSSQNQTTMPIQLMLPEIIVKAQKK